MREVTDLHKAAMDFADQAAEAKRHGDENGFIALSRSALEKESDAAARIANRRDLEPTRSVLHRSAASLALDCGEIRWAERLIGTALSGDPPEEVADELRDLLEDVYFHRHLSLRGVSLQPGEFQMSLEGSGVGFGIARSDYLVGRVKDLETLIFRTAERRLGRDYRDTGRRKKKLAEDLELYVSVPRAASLAVTFRIGKSEQLKLPGIDFPSEVIDDLMSCFEVLNSGDTHELRTRIQDESYFRNFVGLALKIAPDGKDIRTVGFTTTSPGGEREVALSRVRREIRQTEILAPPTITEPESMVVEIRGVLLAADARSQQQGRIEVVSEGKTHRIQVPRGMMSDIVKPCFEEEVVVRGERRGSQILLESIDIADDNGAD